MRSVRGVENLLSYLLLGKKKAKVYQKDRSLALKSGKRGWVPRPAASRKPDSRC